MDIIDHPPRLFASDAEIIALGEDFLAARMTRDAWTHEAHIAVLVYLLNRFSVAELQANVRVLWQRSNEALGIENSDTAGYHHSITLVFVRVIASALKQMQSTMSLCARTNALLQSDIGKRTLPLRYFSQARLLSVAARRDWVEPDVLAL
jgi:hypothetical protein